MFSSEFVRLGPDFGLEGWLMAADSAIISLEGPDGDQIFARVDSISHWIALKEDDSAFGRSKHRTRIQFIGGDCALVKQTGEEVLEAIRSAENHREDSDFVILNEQIEDLRDKMTHLITAVKG
jgi:hypothetical protein